MEISKFIETMNRWGRDKVPFLFAIDFEMEQPWIVKESDLDSTQIQFAIDGVTNAVPNKKQAPIALAKKVIPLEIYRAKFDRVMAGLAYGDSFLTNLTIKTEIETTSTLQEIFAASKATYKLLWRDRFLVFSPETFVKIGNGKILSYPMKGTIDADLTGAEQKILTDQKELAEHVTIVDLIRNDISQVADNVRVTRFRYIDKIRTSHKNLLQVSSEITGDLPADYSSRLGDIIVKLLPAGSVSGAPKKKTVQIIREAEREKRGFYTGVFGYFNGSVLDSGVMIRFIEKDGDKYFYRSGGGITTQSVVSSEYQEAIDKVYVPVD
ncbi:aminodeoxychorismate synthase component I [Pseudochryseolinea flava]|uniref:Aminodeoxychorismate synthase component I n=1 Tax=Pseudochryseolinea flava TaxID=2059302 RepID=A0A364Y1E7_9BACT|nr:aminodeoxychorismate synthase component I [Pseudochryseolinea flava]RAV99906.1 aminodeoxychorismate synthase component I [Pseudochryseolinea flava]